MERINWIKHSRGGTNDKGNLVSWLIIQAIIKQDVMKKLIDDGMKSDDLEIEFRINGVEVPFVETLFDIENKLDVLVAKKAKELIREKFGDIHDTLLDLFDGVTEALTDVERKVRKEFNVPLFEDE